MKRKVAAVIAAVVLVGLGVAVAIGGAGEDPLVAKSYLEDTFPSALSESLEKRAAEGTKDTYSRSVSKLDQIGDEDVKAAEKVQVSKDGYTPRAWSTGDVLALEQGASFVLYDGNGAVSDGVLMDVTVGLAIEAGEHVEIGHRYIVADQSGATVRASSAGHFGAQGTMSVTSGGTQDGDLPFADIKKDDWYYGAVAFVYDKGYFSGVSEDAFSPNTSMTRAMLATVLYRVSGAQKPGKGENFTDVPAGHWYSDGIAWASANGVVNGMGGGTYCPDLAVTREQLVTMLYRYQTNRQGNVSAKGTLAGYPDGSAVAPWAKEPMEWAVGAELVKGRDTGHLDPKGTATRAEVATILQRFDALK